MPDDRTPGYDEPRPGPQDFAAVIAETSRPLTSAEFDDLIASEQNHTTLPLRCLDCEAEAMWCDEALPTAEMVA